MTPPSDPEGVEPTPWDADIPPIIIAAHRGPHTVTVPSPGKPLGLSFEGFPQHVRKAVATQNFPEEAPIALVMPYAADWRMEPPRMLANLADREVWSSDGPIVFRPEEGQQRTWIVLHSAEEIAVSR
ncbi:hypothetical protein ACH4C2_33800 [Streptomyces sp. NPDC018057]|uniref:hypothetical protein n=1 Tax=unclassified Streptomyces TaxID=2593676 RepID=UPI003797BFB8